jgi:hypothetical protein
VVETTETGETSEESIEDRFHQNMLSKDPMDRLFSVAKINTILQDYKKNNFNSLDKKLIRGIFNRKTV